MEILKFKITVESEWFNNPPNLRVHVNNDTLIDGPLNETIIIERDIQLEDETDHTLNFTLHGKNNRDTQLNDQGEIVKDTLIKIKQIEIDDVNITHMLPIDQEKFYYIHDGLDEKHPFYDTMGVNGTSTIKFTTPFYVWLLETL
jgi:hypothetical protein